MKFRILWLIAIAVASAGRYAHATEKNHPVTPLPVVRTTVVVEEGGHGRELAAGLIGAGIAWFFVHRHHKREPVPVLTCPSNDSESLRRELQTCRVTK